MHLVVFFAFFIVKNSKLFFFTQGDLLCSFAAPYFHSWAVLKQLCMIHTVQNKPLHPLPTFVRLARCNKQRALKADGCWQQLLCLRPYQEYSFSLTSSRAKKRKNPSETASFIATCIQQRMKKGIIVPPHSPALSPAVKITSSSCLNPSVPHITHKLTNTGLTDHTFCITSHLHSCTWTNASADGSPG